MSWEIMYVNLWLGDFPRDRDAGKRAVERQMEKIDELCREGWEPVGPATFSYDYMVSGRSITSNMRQYVLKRPRA